MQRKNTEEERLIEAINDSHDFIYLCDKTVEEFWQENNMARRLELADAILAEFGPDGFDLAGDAPIEHQCGGVRVGTWSIIAFEVEPAEEE